MAEPASATSTVGCGRSDPRDPSSFTDLADLWLVDLELRDLAGNTKENYRACLRLHVRPAFEDYTLAEVTTGRVEWFLAPIGRPQVLARRDDIARAGAAEVVQQVVTGEATSQAADLDKPSPRMHGGVSIVMARVLRNWT